MLDPRVKLRHLRALVSLDRHRSVLASANELSRTPSAVSKALGELEAIVGQRLFERSRRGLLPTPAGEALKAQVQRSLGLLGDALDQARGQTLPLADCVTLGVLPTAAAMLAPGALMRFHSLYPDTLLRVIEGTNVELLGRLRRREIDLVIGRLPDAALLFDLSFEPLYEETLVVAAAAGHPLAGTAGLSMQQLGDYPVVLPDHDTILRKSLDPFLIAQGMPRPPRCFETLSVEFARALVLDSAAVWFCAPGVVMPDLQRQQMALLDLPLDLTRRPVGVSVRADMPPAPAVAELTELLRAQARRLRAQPSNPGPAAGDALC